MIVINLFSNSLNHSLQEINADCLFVVSRVDSFAISLDHTAFPHAAISNLSKFDKKNLKFHRRNRMKIKLTMTTFMAISNSSSLIIIIEVSGRLISL